MAGQKPVFWSIDKGLASNRNPQKLCVFRMNARGESAENNEALLYFLSGLFLNKEERVQKIRITWPLFIPASHE
jgi:hypothetical protein